MKEKIYNVLGVMSGSSLDGLDIAFCEFKTVRGDDGFSFKIKEWEIINAETIPFSEQWQNRLFHLPTQNALVFAKTNTYLGHYFAELITDFIKRHKINPDFISSHGHTVFHYPDNRLTVQIGDGAAIAAKTGYPVICDFRTQDIAINGEGAPIAPIADKMLLSGHDFFMNIGGIANITCNVNEKFVAFDIGPANQIFNAFANLSGKEFDDKGEIAKSGTLNDTLFSQINDHPYFKKPYPKTLDNQEVKRLFLNQYLEFEETIENKLRTGVEQLAFQISKSIDDIIKKENFKKDKYKMIITGGGAFNTFLIETIEYYCKKNHPVEIVIPEEKIISFKEAALMALMGVLRVENIPNTIATVTGANFDTIGGAIYQGTKKILI